MRSFTKKHYSIIPFIIALVILTSCSVDLPFTREPVYVDLSGEWVQTNSHNDGKYQGIYIFDDYIEIFWVFDNQSGATLYYSGTFEIPEKLKENDSYTFKSNVDTSRTTLSLLATEDKAKTFTYKNGKLSYEVEYDNMKMTVTAEKRSWGMNDLRYRGIIDMFDIVNVIYQGAFADSTFAEYHIGETWTVPGQWSVQITSASITNARNRYFNRNPTAVYQISYTYSNLGYDDDTDAGLKILLDDEIIDNLGEIGYSYPITTQNSPRQINPGETCNAQDYIAVSNPGTFRLTVTKYGSDGNLYGAIFIVDI